MQWKEKIKAHQDKTYLDKEKSCPKEESTKHDLLEKFKTEDIPGPFTSENEIKDIFCTRLMMIQKITMYDEVRYAKISCVTEAYCCCFSFEKKSQKSNN